MRAARDPRIPDKKYFRIGEVAEIAEVETHTLRFWETEFGSLKPSKSRSNRRTYSQRDVALVLRIRDLLYQEGYTIPGARRVISKGADGAAPAETPARTRAVLARIREETEALLRLVEE